MCTSIFFKETGEVVTTVKGLMAALNKKPRELVWGHSPPETDEDEHGRDFQWCLCPIDIPATLRASGYGGDWDKDGDPMGFIAARVDG